MDKKIREEYGLPLLVLTLAGFAIRLYMAHADPFLHIWDERFHALVARNMMTDPFMPVLRNHPLFPADYRDWSQGHIWVHKQPMFLWQMALSMKVFGVTEYAIRYPSVIMGTLMIPMAFRVAQSVSQNNKIALLTAGLFCFSNFHLELVGGIRSMDHNDLCFEFYALASVWAWMRYENTHKKYWLILIGLFSGMAILTKWLIGLFVFLVWGIKLLLYIRNSYSGKEILRFIAALLICCIVFLPWQFYIIRQFPAEAAFEYEFNARHITEALEGHEGNILFYLARFPQLFGEAIFLLIFPGLYLCFRSKNKNEVLSVPVAGGVLFVFIFLSVIVTTKVISHLYFIAPFVMMYMSYCLLFIMQRIKRMYFMVPLLIVVGILSCKPEKIIMDQGQGNWKRNNAIVNAAAFKRLKQYLPPGYTIIANVPDFVSLMFYNSGVVAYESFSPEQLDRLRAQQCRIAIFRSINGVQAPEHLRRYPYLHIIDIDLKSDRN